MFFVIPEDATPIICTRRSQSPSFRKHLISLNCLYWQVELEVTLPGEGRDRVFKVAIRWVNQVNLFDLERALEGVSRQIPLEAIQALDVVMRHMPSMT